MNSYESKSKRIKSQATIPNKSITIKDNRSSSQITQRVVAQFSGGSHYWRKRSGGKWIYCGKYGNHRAANQAMRANGWTNGNGWTFRQGGRRNPPGT